MVGLELIHMKIEKSLLKQLMNMKYKNRWSLYTFSSSAIATKNIQKKTDTVI